MLGTLFDTIVVCTMTALVIPTSGAWTTTGADGGGLTGAVLASTGFQSSMAGGQYIVTVALAVFAFTTILGWSYYGERCWRYLFSERSLMVCRALWVLAALAFANVKVDLVWNLSDTLNGLMAVPNLIGLLLLAPTVFRVTREYFETLGKPLAWPGPLPPISPCVPKVWSFLRLHCCPATMTARFACSRIP